MNQSVDLGWGYWGDLETADGFRKERRMGRKDHFGMPGMYFDAGFGCSGRCGHTPTVHAGACGCFVDERKLRRVRTPLPLNGSAFRRIRPDGATVDFRGIKAHSPSGRRSTRRCRRRLRVRRLRTTTSFIIHYRCWQAKRGSGLKEFWALARNGDYTAM